MKIKELLEYGKNNLIECDEPYKISRMVLKYILKENEIFIITHIEDEVEEKVQNEFIKNIELIKNGLPVQYITHNQEFMGLNFYVDKNVLIPQPDTEILVEEVLNLIKSKKEEINILDLCTGSGAIGISIAKSVENIKIDMSDISNKALEIANINVINNRIQEKCKFILSDMFENIKEQYDVIVSNPPYIEKNVIKQLSKEVQNEPLIALDGGQDGLDFYRIIAKNAYKFLKTDGILALEIGYNQKEKVKKLLENKYKEIYCKKDLNGNDRVIICKKVGV